MSRDEDAPPRFPPRDQAIIKAIACETVAETGLPLSRLSLADLTVRAHYALGRPISRSTVWRILDGDAIKPWRYEHWLFPRDPRFAEKAGVILDLYAGQWQGKALSPRDHIISADVEDKHPGLTPLPPRHGSRRRTIATGRIRISARRCVAVSGRLGRPAGLRHGPLRAQNWYRTVWSVGGGSDGASALSFGRSRFLGRR